MYIYSFFNKKDSFYIYIYCFFKDNLSLQMVMCIVYIVLQVQIICSLYVLKCILSILTFWCFCHCIYLLFRFWCRLLEKLLYLIFVRTHHYLLIRYST